MLVRDATVAIYLPHYQWLIIIIIIIVIIYCLVSIDPDSYMPIQNTCL